MKKLLLIMISLVMLGCSQKMTPKSIIHTVSEDGDTHAFNGLKCSYQMEKKQLSEDGRVGCIPMTCEKHIQRVPDIVGCINIYATDELEAFFFKIDGAKYVTKSIRAGKSSVLVRAR